MEPAVLRLSPAFDFRLAISFDLTDAYTFGAVGIIGVLLLGAYQADQSGHPRAAAALIGGAIAVLVGPLVVLGILVVALWYAVFLGLPVLGCVLLVRRLLRHRT
jgi:hypothetical protein